MKERNDYFKTLERNLICVLRRGQLEEAKSILRKMQAEAPFARETRILELELLLKEKKLSDSNRLAKDLIKLFPDSSRLFKLAGEAAYQMKEYKDALAHFEEAHRLFNHSEIQLWIGKTLTQLGLFAKAQPLLESIAEQQPRAHQALGWLFERQGNLVRAIESHNHFLNLSPRNPYSQREVERLRAALLTPEDLQQEVTNLLDMGEKIPTSILRTYLKSLLQMGRNQQLRDLLAGPAKDLSSRELIDVAWAAYQAGAHDVAFDLFASQLNQGPTDFKIWKALETSAQILDRNEELIQIYESLCSEKPQLHTRIRRIRMLESVQKQPRHFVTDP